MQSKRGNNDDCGSDDGCGKRKIDRERKRMRMGISMKQRCFW